MTTTEPVTIHATAEVECTKGSQITISGIGCKVKLGTEGNGTIPEETLKDGVDYANKDTSKTEVTINTTVANIPFEIEGPFCSLVGLPSKKGHNAIYTDDVTVKAFEDDFGPCTENSTTHRLEGCEEGKQVDILWE